MAGEERELSDISRIGVHPSGALLIPDGISVLPADSSPTGEPPEHPNPAIAELLAARDELVAAARRASRAQVDLWRQVPWLALQADGRSGYLDKYSYAYFYGYWELERGCCGVSVDLETGELMSSYTAIDEWTGDEHVNPASDGSILCLLSNPKLLDAAAVLEKLREKAKEPTFEHYNEDEIRQWREEIIAKRRLTPLYSRGKLVVFPDPTLIEG